MKSLLKFARPLAPLVLLLLTARVSTAQELKAVGVVSIASIKENLADVAYVTRAAGMADYGDTARFLVGAMSAGIDKERPIGLYFIPKEREFQAIAFVPVEPNGLATIFKVQKDQLGEPRDAGDGVQEIGRARKVFVKEQGGWAFVAEEKAHLSNLPQDPTTMLGDMPTKYNVAGRLMIQNIPAELRRAGIDEIKRSIERFLDSPAARRGKVDPEQARQLSSASIVSLERLLNEADQILIGLSIDEQGKRISLDFGAAAKEGTSLANSMAMQMDLKTNFAGLLLPDAAVTLKATSKMSPEDTAQTRAAVKAAQAQYSKQIDDSPDIPADKREAIKGVLAQVFDLLDQNLATGRTDMGASVLMLPGNVSFAVGGVVADGAAVDKILKSLVDLSKDIPNFPQIKLNDGTIGNVRINRLTMPLPAEQPDLRAVVGDNLTILIGVGPQSVLVTGGKDADGLLKKIVDQSAQQRDVPTQPLELVINLLPMLKFANAMHGSPALNSVVVSLEQTGNDKVLITTEAGQRTSLSHIEVQEGVIRAIGEGAKSAGGGRMRPPGR